MKKVFFVFCMSFVLVVFSFHCSGKSSIDIKEEKMGRASEKIWSRTDAATREAPLVLPEREPSFELVPERRSESQLLERRVEQQPEADPERGMKPEKPESCPPPKYLDKDKKIRIVYEHDFPCVPMESGTKPCGGIWEPLVTKERIFFHTVYYSKTNKRNHSMAVDHCGRVRFNRRLSRLRAWITLLPYKHILFEQDISAPHFNDPIIQTFRQYDLRGGLYGKRLGQFSIGEHPKSIPAFDPVQERLYLLFKERGKQTILRGYNLDRSVAWSKSFPSPPVCSPIIGKDSSVYTCLKSGELVALDKDGKERWRVKSGVEGTDSGALLALSKEGWLVATFGGLLCVHNTKGEKQWCQGGLLGRSGPVVSPKGRIWVFQTGRLRAYDLKTGKSLVKVYIPNYDGTISPTILQDESTLLSLANGLLLQHRSKDGKLIKKLEFPPDTGVAGLRLYSNSRPSGVSPQIFNGKLYVGGGQRKTGQKEGSAMIFEVDFKIPPMAKEGWPSSYGTILNYRTQ